MFSQLQSVIFRTSLVLALFGFSQAGAQVLDPELVDVGLSTAYIPTGFDSNDRVQVMVESYLPDTCYKVGPYTVTVDEANQKVTVKQQAYKYRGVCLMMIVPYHHMVDVGILAKTGSYEVVDAATAKNLGKLPIQQSKSSEPDDYVYAPVAKASVEANANGDYELSLSGVFTDSCASLKQVKVIVESKNVITVQPIVEMGSQNCKAGEFPFSHKHILSGLEKGRYMLHVRSMNGNAVAKLFSVE